MERLINVVGTRIRVGEDDAALRWYADHVQQLLAFPGLHGAELLRRAGAPQAGDAPDMLCLYDFGTPEAFAAYERSEVHAAAARDRMVGWGADGITITSRVQYRRCWRVRRDDVPAAGEAAWQVAAWSGAAPPALERQVAAEGLARGVSERALLRAVDATTLLLLERGGAGPPPPPEGLRADWSGRYRPLLTWSR